MKRDEGFILYSAPTGDDGSSSQLSSQLSSAPSPYASSSQLSGQRLGRAPPPPHTGTLRTNFTSAAANNRYQQEQQRTSALTPNDTDFRNMTTPGPPYQQPPPTLGYASGGYPHHESMVSVGGAYSGFAPQQQAQAQQHQSQLEHMRALLALTTRFRLWLLVLALLVGFGVGALIHIYNASVTVSLWLKLPGELFVRAVSCISVPLLFVNVIVAMAEVVQSHAAARISWRLLLLFLFTNLVGVFEGVGMGYLARAIMSLGDVARPASKVPLFAIACANGRFLAEDVSTPDAGAVTCSASSYLNTTSALFAVTDTNHALVPNAVMPTRPTLSANIINVLLTILPENLTNAFVEDTLIAVVVFAIPCGLVLAHSFHGPVHLNPLLEFIREINDSLLKMMTWVLTFTPLAALSLLTGSVGADVAGLNLVSPIMTTLNFAGFLLLAVAWHSLIVMPLLMLALSGLNPFTHMRAMLPAYLYGVASSSSAAALPVTRRCLEASRTVNTSAVLDMATSLGTTLNMNGSAIYFPLAAFFLIDTSGLNSEFGGVEMFFLGLASLIGAFCASPVPMGTTTLVTAVWSITFPGMDMVDMFFFLVAADVVNDRIVTFCNMQSDAMICRIVEEQVGASQKSGRALLQ